MTSMQCMTDICKHNKKMHVGHRIRELRTREKWSVAKLATLAGVDPGFLSRLERGISSYSPETLKKLADALGMTVAELHGTQPTLAAAPIGKRRVPIVDSVQAGTWTEVYPNLADGVFREYMLVDRRYSERTFAMRVRGDSMSPRFNEGDVIVVDPGKAPAPGSFVVAINGDGEAVLKQFAARGHDDSGREIFELIPLNPLYAPTRSDRVEIRIIGTVRERTEMFP